MPELKLARLPDRTPIKLTISVLPDLHQALQDYARIYAEAYAREEPIVELIPAILTSFLDSDRGFARAREALGKGN
ncbi:DUF2274 domain-containing protein [Allosphingosinicella deserti]|uniref:DUF2274 domain-containing protein n=1 Tax=Allosphingosinicella deserti TaxID=2116704 RepID=A0A2P7QEE9_9SPHN|nr:DUF2274 domain-containing protein [Sphingomonas deserti]PSJ36306.1 DUF2274 domain-containing protein [Sphingomonas deserti]